MKPTKEKLFSYSMNPARIPKKSHQLYWARQGHKLCKGCERSESRRNGLGLMWGLSYFV